MAALWPAESLARREAILFKGRWRPVDSPISRLKSLGMPGRLGFWPALPGLPDFLC